MLFFKRKEKFSQRSAVIPAVLLSAFFGLASGVVGMLVMIAYFPLSELQSSVGLNVSSGPTVQIHAGRTAVEFAVKDISASSVLLFRAEDVGEVTLVTRSVGLGTVLTSDGWILTHVAVLDGAKRPDGKGLVAVVEGAAYKIEKTVIDTYTGVAFLKVNGANLPAAAFGQSEGTTVGDALFSFDVTRGLREAGIIAIGGLPAADAESAVRSSEEIQRVLRLSGAEGFVSGSAVLNSRGEAMGVFVNESEVGAYAIPIDSFFEQIGNVLRDGATVRPYLGIRFVDLSEHPGADGLTRGVKIKSSTRFPAVVRSSPAAVAGLHDGDIIKAVNGEQVTVNRSLSDLLIEYDPDQKVTLTVLRSGTESEIEVTLARMPSK